jgi:hypothetical protein
VNLTLNYPPTDITLSNNSINENSSINTIIGSLSATDPDAGETFTFSIISGGTNFNISGSNLRSSQVFNFELVSSYNVTIRVTDSVGQYFDKLFTINVNNVNETPFGLNLSNNSQQENTSIGSTIGSFTTSDVDSGDTFTYQLYDTANYPDNNSFTLTSAGSLRNGVVFNFESKTSYTIRVRTTDAGGLTYDGTFTINVTNQNEAPTNINLSSSSISENVPTGTTIGTLSATDPDAGDSATFSLVDTSTYPDNSAFNINGTTLRSSIVFNHEAKSSYSIRVRATDASGLTFDKTLTITITDVTIVVTASATTNVTCNGGSNGAITVSNVVGGTANYTYSRDGVNYQVSNVFSSLTAGTYTIYAKDSYNEVGTTSVTVTQPTVVSSSVSGTNPTCFGNTNGSITISSTSGGVGPYTYSINGTNYQSSTTFSNLSSGTYTVYTKDNSGCVVTNTVGLERTQITATTSQSNVTCNGGNNASITISSPSGGQGGPYSTKLNVGGTYQVITTSRTYSTLTAGSYTIYVKDSADCERTYPITITQPTAVTVSLTSSTPPTCYNGGDGSISFSAAGGNGSHQFRLNGGTWQPSGIFTGLNVGTYTIQTRDTNGCESSTTNVTLSKSAPTASVSQTNISCNGGSNGTITVSSPSGGSGSGYTYSRDGVNYQSSGTFSSLNTGSYDIYVKDGVGCVSYLTTITITQPTLQTASITIIQQPNGDSTGIVEITSTGGVFNKTYEVLEDNTFPYNTCGGPAVATFTNVTSGSPTRQVTGLTCGYAYCLKVTDANGCVTNSSLVVLNSCSPTYNCNNGTCTEVFDGTGSYLSLQDCLNNCQQTTFFCRDLPNGGCIEQFGPCGPNQQSCGEQSN